jgi:hypothetical protein
VIEKRNREQHPDKIHKVGSIRGSINVLIAEFLNGHFRAHFESLMQSSRLLRNAAELQTILNAEAEWRVLLVWRSLD